MKIQWIFPVLAIGMISSQAALAHEHEHEGRDDDKDSHRQENNDRDDRGHDGDRVSQWVKEGKTIPLEEILHNISFEGRLLDVEVEQQDDLIIYELEIINPKSVVYTLKVNAKTGKLIDNNPASDKDDKI